MLVIAIQLKQFYLIVARVVKVLSFPFESVFEVNISFLNLWLSVNIKCEGGSAFSLLLKKINLETRPKLFRI